jgi:hypothetical protein
MNIGKIINTVLGWLGFGKTTRERTAEENITAALPLIKSTVAIGIQEGIRYGVAAADRAAIAAQVRQVASVVRSLTAGATPTVDALKQTLLAFQYDREIRNLDTIVGVVAIAYGNYFGQINGNAALAVKVLNAIADGAEQGAAEFVK